MVGRTPGGNAGSSLTKAWSKRASTVSPTTRLSSSEVDHHARLGIDRPAEGHLQRVGVPVDRRERAEVGAVLGVGPLRTRVAVRGREREPPRDGDRGTAWRAHGLSCLTFCLEGSRAGQGRSLKYTGGPSSGRPAPASRGAADSRRKAATSAAPSGAVGLQRGSSPRQARNGTSAPSTSSEAQRRPASRTRAGPRAAAATAPDRRPDQGDPELEERRQRGERVAGREAGRGSSSTRAGSRGGPCTSGRRRGRRRRRTRSARPPAFTLRASATSSRTSPAHRAVAARRLVGVARGQDEDAVGGRERRRRIVHARQRKPLVEQAEHDRLDDALPEGARQLPARQRQERDPVRLREAHGARDRVGSVDGVGVREAEPAAARDGHARGRARSSCRSTPVGGRRRAGPGPAGPAGRRPRGSPASGRVDPSSTATISRCGVSLRRQRREAGAHAALLVPGRDERADEGRPAGRRGLARAGKARAPAQDGRDAPEAPHRGGKEERGGEGEPRDHARDYRPTNRGRRFSRKAAVPSR